VNAWWGTFDLAVAFYSGRPADPPADDFIWEDIRSESDPHELALEFAQSAFQHSCAVCAWDPALAESAKGTPPPIS
jgi:hypothetical protein